MFQSRSRPPTVRAPVERVSTSPVVTPSVTATPTVTDRRVSVVFRLALFMLQALSWCLEVLNPIKHTSPSEPITTPSPFGGQVVSGASAPAKQRTGLQSTTGDKCWQVLVDESLYTRFPSLATAHCVTIEMLRICHRLHPSGVQWVRVETTTDGWHHIEKGLTGDMRTEDFLSAMNPTDLVGKSSTASMSDIEPTTMWATETDDSIISAIWSGPLASHPPSSWREWARVAKLSRRYCYISVLWQSSLTAISDMRTYGTTIPGDQAFLLMMERNLGDITVTGNHPTANMCGHLERDPEGDRLETVLLQYLPTPNSCTPFDIGQEPRSEIILPNGHGFETGVRRAVPDRYVLNETPYAQGVNNSLANRIWSKVRSPPTWRAPLASLADRDDIIDIRVSDSPTLTPPPHDLFDSIVKGVNHDVNCKYRFTAEKEPYWQPVTQLDLHRTHDQYGWLYELGYGYRNKTRTHGLRCLGHPGHLPHGVSGSAITMALEAGSSASFRAFFQGLLNKVQEVTEEAHAAGHRVIRVTSCTKEYSEAPLNRRPMAGGFDATIFITDGTPEALRTVIDTPGTQTYHLPLPVWIGERTHSVWRLLPGITGRPDTIYCGQNRNVGNEGPYARMDANRPYNIWCHARYGPLPANFSCQYMRGGHIKRIEDIMALIEGLGPVYGIDEHAILIQPQLVAIYHRDDILRQTGTGIASTSSNTALKWTVEYADAPSRPRFYTAGFNRAANHALIHAEGQLYRLMNHTLGVKLSKRIVDMSQDLEIIESRTPQPAIVPHTNKINALGFKGTTTLFTFGTRGDRVPIEALGRTLARMGAIVRVQHLLTNLEGRKSLAAAEAGHSWTQGDVLLEAQATIDATPGIKVVPWMLKSANTITYSLAPLRTEIRGVGGGLGSLDAIARWYTANLPVDFRVHICGRPGCLPRSHDGWRYPTHSVNTGKHPQGVLAGSSSTPIPAIYKDWPIIPDGDHSRILRDYKVVACAGGAGAVQTARLAGCQVITWDSSIDRNYRDKWNAGLAGKNDTNPNLAIFAVFGTTTATLQLYHQSLSWRGTIRGWAQYVKYYQTPAHIWTWIKGLFVIIGSINNVPRIGLRSGPIETLLAVVLNLPNTIRGRLIGLLLTSLLSWAHAEFLWDLTHLIRQYFMRYLIWRFSLIGGLSCNLFGEALGTVLAMTAGPFIIQAWWLATHLIKASILIYARANSGESADVYLKVRYLSEYVYPLIHVGLYHPATGLTYEGAHAHQFRFGGAFTFKHRSERPDDAEWLIPTALTSEQFLALPVRTATYGAFWNCLAGLFMILGPSRQGLGLLAMAVCWAGFVSLWGLVIVGAAIATTLLIGALIPSAIAGVPARQLFPQSAILGETFNILDIDDEMFTDSTKVSALRFIKNLASHYGSADSPASWDLSSETNRHLAAEFEEIKASLSDDYSEADKIILAQEAFSDRYRDTPPMPETARFHHEDRPTSSYQQFLTECWSKLTVIYSDPSSLWGEGLQFKAVKKAKNNLKETWRDDWVDSIPWHRQTEWPIDTIGQRSTNAVSSKLMTDAAPTTATEARIKALDHHPLDLVAIQDLNLPKVNIHSALTAQQILQDSRQQDPTRDRVSNEYIEWFDSIMNLVNSLQEDLRAVVLWDITPSPQARLKSKGRSEGLVNTAALLYALARTKEVPHDIAITAALETVGVAAVEDELSLHPSDSLVRMALYKAIRGKIRFADISSHTFLTVFNDLAAHLGNHVELHQALQALRGVAISVASGINLSIDSLILLIDNLIPYYVVLEKHVLMPILNKTADFLLVIGPDLRRSPKSVWAILYPDLKIPYSTAEMFALGLPESEPYEREDFDEMFKRNTTILNNRLPPGVKPLNPEPILRPLRLPERQRVGSLGELSDSLFTGREILDTHLTRQREVYKQYGAKEGVDGVLHATPELEFASLERYQDYHRPEVSPDLEILSIEAADALGDEFSEFFRDIAPASVEASASYLKKAYNSGMYFTGVYRTRKDLVDTGVMQAVIECAKKDFLAKGKYPGQMYGAFPKEQVISKIKATLPGGLRTIVAQDLLSYFCDSVVQLWRGKQSPPRELLIGSGLKLTEGGMSWMFEEMAAYKTVFATDEYQYDAHIAPVLMRAVEHLGKRAYEHHPNAKALQSLVHNHYAGLRQGHIFDYLYGFKLTKTGGGATGQISTSFDNTMSKKIKTIMTWAIITGDHPSEFFKLNYFGNTSDDDFWATNDDRVTLPAVIEVSSLLGMTLKVEAEGMKDMIYLQKRPVPGSEFAHEYESLGAPVPEYAVITDPGSLLSKRWAHKYTKSGLDRTAFGTWRLLQTIGHMELAAHQPEIYSLLAREYMDIAQTMFMDTVDLKWRITTTEAGAITSFDLASKIIRDENTPDGRVLTYTDKRTGLPIETYVSGKADKQIINISLKTRERTVGSKQIGLLLHAITKPGQLRAPSYRTILLNWIKPSKPKTQAELNSLILKHEPKPTRDALVRHRISKVRAALRRGIPDVIVKSGGERPGTGTVDAFIGTRFSIEKFIYKCLTHKLGREPSLDEFTLGNRDGPYSSNTDALGFYLWMGDPANHRSVMTTPIDVYQNKAVMVTLLYILLDRWLERARGLPLLGVLVEIFHLYTRERSRVYAATNQLHWLVTGESSAVISGLIPKDAYVMVKRTATILADIIPEVLLNIPVIRHLKKPLEKGIEIYVRWRTWRETRLMDNIAYNRDEKNPWMPHVLSLIDAKKNEDRTYKSISSPTASGKSTLMVATMLNVGFARRIWLAGPTETLRDEYANKWYPHFERVTTGRPPTVEIRLKVLTFGTLLNLISGTDMRTGDLILLDEPQTGAPEAVAVWSIAKSKQIPAILLTATPRHDLYPGSLPQYTADVPRRFKNTVIEIDAPIGALIPEAIHRSRLNKTTVLVLCRSIAQVELCVNSIRHMNEQVSELSARNRVPAKLGHIVATSIADQGLTIDPARAVVLDLGEETINIRGNLRAQRSSETTSIQREGRAPRLQDGYVIRRSVTDLPDPMEPIPYPAMGRWFAHAEARECWNRIYQLQTIPIQMDKAWYLITGPHAQDRMVHDSLDAWWLFICEEPNPRTALGLYERWREGKYLDRRLHHMERALSQLPLLSSADALRELLKTHKFLVTLNGIGSRTVIGLRLLDHGVAAITWNAQANYTGTIYNTQVA